MANKQLLNYIKQQLRQGVSRGEIEGILLRKKWQKKDIDEAFNILGKRKLLKSHNMPGASLFQQNMKLTGSNKKPLVLIVYVILGAAIIGSCALAYVYYFQSPEKIVQKMVEKMAEIKSLKYAGKLAIEIKTNRLDAQLLSEKNTKLRQETSGKSFTEKKSKLSISFNGGSDFHDINNIKMMYRSDINIDATPQSFKVEARIVKDYIYLKLANVHSFSNFEPFDLSFLNNKWTKAKLDTNLWEIKKQLGFGESIGRQEKTSETQKISPEQAEKIKKAIVNSKIIKITRKLPGRKINGIDTYHYEFAIDKGELIQLFIDIDKIINNKPPAAAEEEAQRVKKEIERIEAQAGEIWIGKKDLLLHKILLGFNIVKTGKTKSIYEVSMDVQFKGYNNPVYISVPTSTKPLWGILGEKFSANYLAEILQNHKPGIQLTAR